jgi:sterol desaturase/sphingolipid hydroxylase (fatty acid hydroxylase superfamily)
MESNDTIDLTENDFSETYGAIKAYSPLLIVTLLCSLILELSTTPILQLFTGFMFIYLWSYFIHRIDHNLPTDGIFYYLNPHISLHHEMVKRLPRWVELIIEGLQDLGIFYLLYYIQELLDIHITPTSIIFLVAISYTTTHIINYTMFTSDTHRDHHIHKNVNYGPDFLDHIFGTNSDKGFEDMSHMIPNIIVSFLITYWLFKI